MGRRLTKQEKLVRDDLYAFRHRAADAMQGWRQFSDIDDAKSANELQNLIIEAMRWAQNQEKL